MRGFVFLGTISYSIYLVHFFIIIIINRLIIKNLSDIISNEFLWYGGLLFTLSAVTVISYLFYRLVEMPLVGYVKGKVSTYWS